MDKAKKKRIKRYFTWAAMAAVVVVLTVMPLMAKNDAAKDGPQASILSAQVAETSLSRVLRGGGTLESQDAEDINIPTGVKITGFLVKNGDLVQKGTPLATVDKVSVLSAISSVTDTMEYLRQALEDGREEKVAEVIKAVPGGRVKKIFAKEGESVQDVILRDGCLAVLSIDSLMAVEIEARSSLATGEGVKVTLPEGTVIDGRVESNLDGKVIVTVEDEGYEVGLGVTVEGLGEGTLFIHNAWKTTAYAGTISRVYAKEEQTLSANANLFSLSDRDFTGQLQHRANQHREYEELLQRLLAMYESGTIDAPCEGVVSGVDKESAHLLAAEGEWEVELLENEQPKYRILFLSDVTYECQELAGCEGEAHDPDCILACKNDDTCQGNNHKTSCPEACIETQNPETACPADHHKVTCIHACVKADKVNTCNAKYHKKECIQGCDGSEKCPSEKHRSDCIKLCIQSDGKKDCPAQNHYSGCIERCAKADKESGCTADRYHYADCIKSCTSSKSAKEECPATKHKDDCHFKGMTYKAYVAMVRDRGRKELLVYKDTRTEYTVEKTASGWKIVSPQLNLNLLISEDKVTVGDSKKFNKNDVILLVTGYKDGKPDWTSVELYQRSLIGDTDIGAIVEGAGNALGNMDLSGLTGGMDLSGLMGGMDLSGMIGGFSGFGNYGGLTEGETENLYDLEGSTLLTVTPRKSMKLTITLDEQDIAKVAPGMKATVKVEALKGQEFPATVTKVSASGTNSGGSSKFTADLVLDAQENMLSGMSAAAELSLENREAVLTLPVEAVTEDGARTLVYTALDPDSGLPANPVEVTTGSSDGSLVEILSGLSLGDTVHYSYYDTLELDTSAEADRFTLR